MSDHDCSRCERPVRDTATVCERCLDELGKALHEMPWLEREIQTSVTRQRSSTGGGSRSAEHGLPWNEKASEAQRALHSTLSTWVRFCIEERVRSSDYRNGTPADTLASMARWLTWRLDGIGHHELGADAVDEITSAVDDVRREVFRKPATRIYLGTCTHVDEDDTRAEACGHAIYAREGSFVGRCSSPDCEAEYDVAASRASLENALDSRLVTAAEVAILAVHLGLDQPRDRVRKRVNQWASRGRIEAKGEDDSGMPRFRYAEVRTLLYAEFAPERHADTKAG